MIKDSTIALLGKDFFKEEVRYDFLVSEKMKHIWATEIDLYLQFARICEKHNLQYFVFFGTVLGAVRHHGFIPWDDDLDVAMPRKDYEIFLRVAPEELSHPYFLQTPYTDPGCYLTLTRLRNSTTTGLIETFSHNKFNQGIWIDIDILDKCDIKTVEQEREQIMPLIMKCATSMRRGCRFLSPKRIEELEIYKTDNPLREYETIQSIAKKPQGYVSDFVCAATSSPYSIKKQTWRKECFANYIDMPFEGISVRVPIGYKDYLTTTYGNYMEYPSLEQRRIWHGGNIMDPFKPYTEYLKDID